VFFCPHTELEGCTCRKPLPGLFEQIGERYGVDLAEVPVVGDSLRDLQAGAAAGCPTHLVRSGKVAKLGEEAIARLLESVPDAQVHHDLAAFAEALIKHQRAVHFEGGKTDSGYGHLE
jgi:D-glycero-D-manno-heptose 1,7-bisphosphate phosphatase